MQQRSGGTGKRARPIIAVVLTGCLVIGVDIVGATEPMATPTVTYSIDAHIVANGSTVTSRNACHRLRATIGEPVAGYATNAGHALSAGFSATVRSLPGDDLFFSGFEACP